MARINLLPWREWRRNERKREFAVAAAGSAVVMLGVIFVVHMNIAGLIGTQESRNQFLQQQIAEMNAKIREIRELESEKTQLLSRMGVIEQLQRNRPEIVHLFDEVVRLVPEGLSLVKVEQKGDLLTIEGTAQSNARISALMRNLAQSEWFGEPELQVIQATREGSGESRRFVMNVKQASPVSSREEER